MGKAAQEKTAKRKLVAEKASTAKRQGPRASPSSASSSSSGLRRALSRKALAALVLQRPSAGTSTKLLEADLATVQRHLGRPCPHFGKKGVVQLASSKAENPPKFNKYAGWVEWRNAIFLWMNASGGAFVNTFSGGGRQVNWYVGGAKPTEQSPIVRRLLAGRRSSSSSASPSAAPRAGGAKEGSPRVLLFVRPRETEPYVFCGRCGYVSHNGGKKGFEFTWKLLEFPALSKAPAFAQIIDLQRGAAGASKRGRTSPTVVGRWAA